MWAATTRNESGTAIAINPKTRKVLLLVGKVAKSYSYEDIRSWSANQGQRSGGAVGHGLQGVLTAGARNMADANRADQETGLFVKVRDIEHAEWRISMFDGAARARWVEILQQEINERRTGAEANSH